MKNSVEKHEVLANKIILAYKTLDFGHVTRLLKNKPSHLIINSLNVIDDPNVIIFAILAFNINSKKYIHLIKSLNFDKQENVLEKATNSQLKKILKNLYADELIQLMDDHQNFKKKIFLCIDKEQRDEVKKISSYEDGEVGRIMNPEILALQNSWTISKAINYIKEEYKDVETSSMIYVINKQNKLIGVVRIHDIFFSSKRSVKISSIMSTDFYKVNANDDIEKVSNLFDKYRQNSFPVVNSRNILVGIIHNTDIASAMQEEATEDIYNLYGITELKNPYFHSSVLNIVKSRLLWLIILMITSTMTSIVLDQFQQLGESMTSGLSSILLVPLLPVLTGTSGNAGSQASASIIRSLSIGEITKAEYWKAILKEIKVGIIIGLILAIVNFVRLLIYYAIFHDFKDINEEFNELYKHLAIISATTSLTLFISIVISKLLGSCLPILATRFKIDPTVMSAPILATILDVTTTTTLFGIGIFVVNAIFP